MLVIGGALALSAGEVLAGDYATCILDQMPEVMNDTAARSVMVLCNQKYPAGMREIKTGSGRGMWGYDSGLECIREKAKGTASPLGAKILGAACHRLYDEPRPFDPSTAVPENPQPVQAPPVPVPAPVATPPAPTPSAADIHYQRIHAAHPDADVIVGSPAFKRWISAVPQRQLILTGGTTDQVIQLFTDYQRSQVPAQPQIQAAPIEENPPCEFKQVMSDAELQACGVGGRKSQQ